MSTLLCHRKPDPMRLQILVLLVPADRFFCTAEISPHLVHEP